MPPPPTLPPPTIQSGPVPPPKDVPWWGALILAILVSIVSVISTIYFLKGQAAPGAPPGISALLTDTILYLPHILILFGILADIFTLQGAYSIPSLVGLCSIPLNFALQYFWDGVSGLIAGAIKLATSTPGQSVAEAVVTQVDQALAASGKGCEISGFEFLSSKYAPQSLVVTSTVFWYYLLDLLMNRDPLDSVFTWLAFILFFGLQAMVLKNSCTNLTGSFYIKTFIAFAEGFVIGGTGYGIVQGSIPTRLPSAVLPQGPNLSSLSKQADGTYTDGNGTPYIVGPDGRPIPVSFIQQASAGND